MSGLPVVNVEGLNAVLKQIKEHPETWDQEFWHCGTTHCFAGWAQILSGDETSSTRNAAMRFLGITYNEGVELFSSGNTLEAIEAILADIISAKDDGVYKTGYFVFHERY